MNVVCIGSGYVGSVTGAAFAVLGHHTTVLDIDESKIKMMQEGRSPIYEPGLDELISVHIGSTLFATTNYEIIREADVIFIGVGTPSKVDGTADLKYIKLAAAGIGKHLSPDRFTVIVNKSTVPVGTADLVSSVIAEHSGLRQDAHYSVVSNPEFLREGYALEDVFFPDRIVIGASNEKAKMVMKNLYYNLVNRLKYNEKLIHVNFTYRINSEKPVYFETDVKSAEMIKYAANAFLAIKISYINEIARLCEALGADVNSIAAGMGLDSRIGNKFLQVSSGWSGSCFPKDTAELLATSRKYGCELGIVNAAVESNKEMHSYVVEKIKRKLKTLNGKTVGILGLTFKPNTDDARYTQASVIIGELLDLGARVKAHDPKGMDMFKIINPNMEILYCDDAHEATKDADATILLTHWEDYMIMNWKKVFKLMKKPYILDTRNFLAQLDLPSIGFEYEGIGIGAADEVQGIKYAVS
jgi:UDPglucose 6-dehydrogenase